MTEPDLVAETGAERRRIVELLADLSPEQWGAPTLCAGWRVREVVAHITMPYRLTADEFTSGLANAGYDFNQYADEQARADTERLSDDELLASLRDNVDHPWQPPGGGATAALSHDVIHGLDITEPLGLQPSPPARIALVLNDAGEKNLEYFGTSLDGIRLVASDADVTLGDGTTVELPARDILLAVTGRHPMPTP